MRRQGMSCLRRFEWPSSWGQFQVTWRPGFSWGLLITASTVRFLTPSWCLKEAPRSGVSQCFLVQRLKVTPCPWKLIVWKEMEKEKGSSIPRVKESPLARMTRAMERMVNGFKTAKENQKEKDIHNMVKMESLQEKEKENKAKESRRASVGRANGAQSNATVRRVHNTKCENGFYLWRVLHWKWRRWRFWNQWTCRWALCPWLWHRASTRLTWSSASSKRWSTFARLT